MHITSIPHLRRAIMEARFVFVAVMNGNQTWSVQITKTQAREMVKDIARNWKTCADLDVSAYGFTEQDGKILHLGGM